MLGLIALGGNFEVTEEIRSLIPESFFSVAADGGARHFESLEITPDLLVGDMDSINDDLLKKYKERNIEVETYNVKKDYTDSEIALKKAIEKGCDEFLFIGAFGSRLDHMFSNQMMAASLARRGMKVTLTDGISFFYTVSSYNSPLRYTLTEKDIFGSVFSLVMADGKNGAVSIRGLEYEVKEDLFEFGTGKGVSNEASGNSSAGENVEISVENGVAFFIKSIRD